MTYATFTLNADYTMTVNHNFVDTRYPNTMSIQAIAQSMGYKLGDVIHESKVAGRKIYTLIPISNVIRRDRTYRAQATGFARFERRRPIDAHAVYYYRITMLGYRGLVKWQASYPDIKLYDVPNELLYGLPVCTR